MTAAINALQRAIEQNTAWADLAKADLRRLEEEMQTRSGDLVRYSARNSELTAALELLKG